MRASYLASNPLTALVLCTTCARRNLFDKKTWEEAGFLRCDNCRSKICYKTMRVIPAAWEGGMAEGELEELRAVEAEVRAFVKYFDHHVKAAEDRGSKLHPFAPRTVEMVESFRPALERLDRLRQGGPQAG
jgi:DNA-directed RNA polymerase subunit RPC12/RpoP